MNSAAGAWLTLAALARAGDEALSFATVEMPHTGDLRQFLLPMGSDFGELVEKQGQHHGG